jgi:hypothetical protein
MYWTRTIVRLGEQRIRKVFSTDTVHREHSVCMVPARAVVYTNKICSVASLSVRVWYIWTV